MRCAFKWKPSTREHDAVSNFSVSTFADATNVGVYDEGTDQVSGYLSGLRPFFRLDRVSLINRISLYLEDLQALL